MFLKNWVTSLQGNKCNIFTLKYKLLLKKGKNVKNGSSEMYRVVDDLIIEKIFSKDLILKVLIDHLKCLNIQFQKYLQLNFYFEKEI